MTNKKCPYCNQKLRRGYIKSRGEVLAWSPNPKQKSIFSSRWHTEKEDIVLSDFHMFSGCKVSTLMCENCKKIIIDLNDNN